MRLLLAQHLSEVFNCIYKTAVSKYNNYSFWNPKVNRYRNIFGIHIFLSNVVMQILTPSLNYCRKRLPLDGTRDDIEMLPAWTNKLLIWYRFPRD